MVDDLSRLSRTFQTFAPAPQNLSQTHKIRSSATTRIPELLTVYTSSDTVSRRLVFLVLAPAGAVRPLEKITEPTSKISMWASC